jgi:Kef-type K+ transport system membrane component KefB
MMSNFQLSVLFFLQLAFILGVCRLAGWAARWIRQPQVVGEMIAGVLIGPSLLGLFFPDMQKALFPPQSMTILFAISQVGLSLYMFLVGLEFNVGLFQQRLGGAASVSVAGMVAPFLLGGTLGFLLAGTPGLFGTSIHPFEAALFLGAAMSITAFPMLARIIYERGLAGTSLGTLALAAGAIDDASAWCVLAIVLASMSHSWWVAVKAIGGGVIYAAVVLIWGARLLAPLVRKTEEEGRLTHGMLTAVLALVMLVSWYTDAIGIYAVFGAFILGVGMPRGLLTRELQRLLEPLVVVFLLPLFFTYSGLNTRLDLVNRVELLWITGLVLMAACLGKGGACYAAARWSGEDHRSSMAIGSLMNARGLMELIILNIGLQHGVIQAPLFSIMVVMAIVTTLMASPLFEWVYGARARARGELGQAPGDTPGLA